MPPAPRDIGTAALEVIAAARSPERETAVHTNIPQGSPRESLPGTRRVGISISGGFK